MLKKVLCMPYIVVVAVLWGIILPIWKVERVELDKKRHIWKDLVSNVAVELDVVGVPTTKKWLTYHEKRLTHCPRMPCKTTVLIR